jgi:hypothetical protein
MNNVLAFSAMLYGQAVRITVDLGNIDITSRDNEQDFDSMTCAIDLCEIEYEGIYEI